MGDEGENVGTAETADAAAGTRSMSDASNIGEESSTHNGIMGESDQFACGPNVLNGVRGCGFAAQATLQHQFGKLASTLLTWALSGASSISNSVDSAGGTPITSLRKIGGLGL